MYREVSVWLSLWPHYKLVITISLQSQLYIVYMKLKKILCPTEYLAKETPRIKMGSKRHREILLNRQIWAQLDTEH